jgi:hypothetical protein
MPYDFVVGDTLSEIEVQFIGQDGTPPDISGGTVKLNFRILLGEERVRGALISRDMTIEDGPSAQAKYVLQAIDLAEGVMRCEFIITLQDERQATSLEFTDFLVRARL